MPAIELTHAISCIESKLGVIRSDDVIAEANGLLDLGTDGAMQFIQSILPNANRVNVPFATEAGIYQNADISTIVLGPGSIEQAHKPDEFIEISQLSECLTFLEKMVAAIADSRSE